MGASDDKLSTLLQETTIQSDSLQAQQTALQKRSQQFSLEIAEEKSALAALKSQIKNKDKPPTLKTHSSAEITRWYREKVWSIIHAGKRYEQGAESTPDPSRSLSQ